MVVRVLRAHVGLVVVLVAGLALRVALIAGYTPAILNNPDTWGYVKGAGEELFVPEVRRPAGYAIVLRALHSVSDSLQFAIVVQHLLGLVAVVLVYAIVVRAGAGRGAALAPAVVAALSIDLLYLAHAPLSETTFMVLLLGAAFALQSAMEHRQEGLTRGRAAAYACAGLLLGAAITVRTSAVFVVPLLVLLVVLVTRQRLVMRLAHGALVAVPVVLVVLAYVVAQNSATGFLGLTPGGGWMLYARAAPFADCRYFAEPRGTEGLCEARPEAERPGGDYYAWDPGSPAHGLGLAWQDADPLLADWSREAIVQLPKAYLSNVATDLWRYADPYPERRVLNGGTPDLLAVDTRWEQGEQLNRSVIDPYYGGDSTIRTSAVVGTLAELQRVLRFHGPLMLASLLLVLTGVVFARGAALRSLLLMAAVGFVVPVVTVLTVMWGWRYVVPLQPAIAAAGVIGAVATVGGLTKRWGQRRLR
jgi:Dolichyl-phosphate-mannose-protein mannosyltransferase